MHWHILGAGAIGCLWAGILSRAGQDVTLILRNRHTLDQWPTPGRLDILQAGTCHSVDCHLETLAADTTITHLLVATKAYDTLSAIEAIQPRLSPDAEVVLLQNGMGQQQAVHAYLPTHPLWAATTTAGAWREARHRVHCVSLGDTHIGALSAATSYLPAGWADMDIPLQHCTDIYPHLWRKLAINCAINPLTALFDCHNGKLLTHPERKQKMYAACHEVERVAAAAGITLFSTSLTDQATTVATATAANVSSMLADVRHQRRTEIEQITGFLCQQAQALGIEVPVNRSLLQQIRALGPNEGAH
ncbi:MAG: 2-dehydropantoate 2-reductase [Oceanospirillales bacterium]|uniref:2-dehydropantoate 2-reductase n=1 Tax=Marinobacterium halophilum TaxID=267374 RepID=A0A2P8EYS4_9GAMM|nr:2-dehydropantoate 2-reductase [Marinobacterium halophilum]MBR9827242.1 2-dehydropantoate 2-reductase [Oceanospirillales bacterium]PSL14616.1 ketopantoate reductase [Marinobacterium halophilum]